MGLSAREKRVCDDIAGRADRLLADLRAFVNIPTGGFNHHGIDETRGMLAGRLEDLGAATATFPAGPKPDWLFGAHAERPGPVTAVCGRLVRGRPRILIAGHLDTVHEPLSDFRELTLATDGKTATGPGCVDMKGGLVIAVTALEALEACGLEASWSFLMNADEETGSYHSEDALRAQARAHDIGLAVEPALPGGELAVERMGSGQFLIEARGRSAHVGRAFTEGVSAVTALARAVLAVSDMPRPAEGRILNIGPLRGSAATNVVPDLARAWGNVRYPTRAAAEAIGAELDALATVAGAVPSVIVKRSFNRPAKPETAGVRALAAGARTAAEDLGQNLPFASTGGVCDGNILQSAGLPTIDTLGVRGGGLHTPNEWIEIASLVERCQLLAVLIHRLTTGAVQVPARDEGKDAS
jgi:glutamate carboxypeptidase